MEFRNFGISEFRYIMQWMLSFLQAAVIINTEKSKKAYLKKKKKKCDNNFNLPMFIAKMRQQTKLF